MAFLRKKENGQSAGDLILGWQSPMAQMVKNLPAMQKIQETRVQSLGLEELLEEDVATHSRILTWRIPWTEEPGGLWSWGRKESNKTE